MPELSTRQTSTNHNRDDWLISLVDGRFPLAPALPLNYPELPVHAEVTMVRKLIPFVLGILMLEASRSPTPATARIFRSSMTSPQRSTTHPIHDF
jgi:hypothetical protein